MAQAQPPFAVPRAPAGLADEPPRKARRTALRVFLGIVLLVAIAGGATVAVVANEVGGIDEAFKTAAAVKVEPQVLAPTYKGGPETLLLVGNDERKAPKGEGPENFVGPHSNEMLLVRIDPSKPTISMLSIPRELWVPIHKPDGEVEENRINSALFFGYEEPCCSIGRGFKLMLQTIKQVTNLSVNHVFMINFKKFEHAIEEIGCIYFPVDKRYYHNNNEPGAEQYFEINLKPGYQTLCGKEALEFVANRHESTSLVRDARDQRFILEAKKQYGGSLFEEREKFEHILAKNVVTTLQSSEILDLLELLVESAGKPTRQIQFKVQLGATHDTATPEEIHEAASQFLGGTKQVSHKRVENALSVVKQKAHRKAALEPSMAPTSEEALDHARSVAPDLSFPLEYPLIRNSDAEAEPDELRLYKLHGPDHRRYASYVVVIDRGLLGQYYDVEGTRWQDPPIISKPSDEITVGKRNYMLFYSGEHIVTVAWRDDGAVYWVENTLSNNVSPRQMIEIAEETQPVDGSTRTAPVRRAKEAQAALEIVAKPTNTKARDEKIAIGVSAASLIAMLALIVLVLFRRRELRELREEIAQAVALESRRLPSAGP